MPRPDPPVKAVHDLGTAIEKAVHDLGTVIEKGAQDAGTAIEKGARDGGKAIENGAHVVGKTLESVAKNPVEILPVCWGAPQKCREEAAGNQKVSGEPRPRVSVSYRVDCIDRQTGRDSGDQTLTVTAPSRDAAVAEIERVKGVSDLCQGTGDMNRVTKPGSGRYLN